MEDPPASHPDPDGGKAIPEAFSQPQRRFNPDLGLDRREQHLIAHGLDQPTAKADDELRRPALEAFDEFAELILGLPSRKGCEVDQIGKSDRERNRRKPILVGVEHSANGSQQVPPPGVHDQPLERGETGFEPIPGTLGIQRAAFGLQPVDGDIHLPVGKAGQGLAHGAGQRQDVPLLDPTLLNKGDRALEGGDIGIGVRRLPGIGVGEAQRSPIESRPRDVDAGRRFETIRVVAWFRAKDEGLDRGAEAIPVRVIGHGGTVQSSSTPVEDEGPP